MSGLRTTDAGGRNWGVSIEEDLLVNKEYQAWAERYRNSLPEKSRRKNSARFDAYLEYLYRHNKMPDGQAVRDWIDYLRSYKGYADGTLRNEWSIIRRGHVVNNLEWPFRRGDAPLVREQSRWTPALDPEDIRQMIRACQGLEAPFTDVGLGPHHRACLLLATVWGCRRIEMVEMKPEYIDRRSGTLFIETAKSGRQRYHVLPEDFGEILSEWGFNRPVSERTVSFLFEDLKRAIGLVMAPGHEMGWHAIRRSAAKVAQSREVGFTEAEAHMYYRWKRSGSNMALMYAGSPTVGRGGITTDVNTTDKQLDLRFYESHPFVHFWRES